MAVFELTDPSTGQVFEISGIPEPTSQEEAQALLNQATGQGQQPQQPQQKQQVTQQEIEEPRNILGDLLDLGGDIVEKAKSFGEGVIGTGEALGTLATGAIAEPVAGLTGAGVTALTGDSEAGQAVIEDVRKQLTFQPRTEVGQERLQQAGAVLGPVGEVLQKAEKALGDSVFEKTGSPALAAAATTLPTAFLEILGVKGTRIAKNIKKARQAKAIGKEIDKLITQAAHSADELRGISSGVFKEIDNLGATVNANAFGKFSNELKTSIAREGLDPDVTPGSFKAMKRIEDALPDPVTGEVRAPLNLSEIDTLRNVAQNAAGSTTNLRDARIGGMIVDRIDEFIDQADTKVLTASKGVNVGERYKVARRLWGQAKRGEMIEEALAKAERPGTSLENAIRTKFRQILDNKKKSKFFSKSELDQMNSVVKGSKGTNLFTLLGKLGPSDSGKGIIGLSLGITGGSVIAGEAGAVFVPFLGWLSKKQALRMTRGAAQYADAVVRAGKDSKKLAEAYIRNTPKALRDPGDFAAMLINGDANLAKLPKSNFMNEAAQIAQQRKLALRDILAAGGLAQQAREQSQQPIGAE